MGHQLIQTRFMCDHNIDKPASEIRRNTVAYLGGAHINIRRPLTGIEIPMVKIRGSRDRLIFNMGVPIPGKTVFVLRWALEFIISPD